MFRIRVGNREELITIDRIKPACVDPNVPVPVEFQPSQDNVVPNVHNDNFPDPDGQ